MPDGAAIFSFDFELAWGSRTSSRENPAHIKVEQTRGVVKRILAMLERLQIHATWATVGHLMVREEDCADGRYSQLPPSPKFAWFDGPWYDGIPEFGKFGYDYYYAPDVIAQVVTCAVEQELAAHSFSHVIFDDAACTPEIARAELDACQDLAHRWGRTLTSMVFPRNAIGQLDVLREAGFQCYRARNAEWYWLRRSSTFNARRSRRLLVAPLRWLDEQFCFTPPLPPVRRIAGLWEIPHSMFFPGMSGISQLIAPALRAKRAIRGMHRAAREGRIFSLSLHPHDLVVKQAPLLDALEEILEEAARLRHAGDLQIFTMKQLSDEMDEGRGARWLEGSQEDVKRRESKTVSL